MAYPILVCLDNEEMGPLTPQQMQWVMDPSRTDRTIRDLSMQWPNSTILVYGLQELQKLKTTPTYQRYIVSKFGEIVPK